MPRSIRCPTCDTQLRFPTDRQSGIARCPECRAKIDLDNWDNEEEELEPERTSNPFKRYARWAGTRSLIFQALLLGWTACVFLATIGLLVSTLAKNPRNRIEEDAQAIAFGTMSCCSLSGYCLVAIPLAIAAIATLEARKK